MERIGRRFEKREQLLMMDSLVFGDAVMCVFIHKKRKKMKILRISERRERER